MPSVARKFRLYDLMLDRVDLCGTGANPGAAIVLFKSKEDDVPQPKKKAKAPAKKVKGKADARSKSKQRGDEDEEDDEDDDAVAKSEEDEDEEDDAEDEEDDVEKSEDDDEDDDAVDDEEDEEDEAARPTKKRVVKKPAKQVAKGKDKDEDENEDDEEFDDAEDDDDVEAVDEKVLKTLPPAIRAQIERNERVTKRARAQAREATRLVTAEKNRRERLEFIEKAKTTIPNLPGTAEDKGELLQALYADVPLTKDMRKTVMRLLRSGNEAMAMQMAEVGRRTTGDDEDDSPHSQLEGFAEELMEKDNKLTKSAAFVKACEQHPKLYQQYRLAKNHRSADVN